MEELIIGLGSNLGDRRANLEEAIRRMSERFGAPLRISSFIETEPWGYQSGNRYLNGAAIFMVEEVGAKRRSRSTGIEEVGMVEMLKWLKGIEKDMGRIRTGDGYSDRPIDLDILFFGDRVISTPELTIPHPHLHEREFVLRPLMEICPQKVHPVLRLTITEIVRGGEVW
ncbi:MAG: 2-amino-4-hydroxy-6-hydroxymethyldihydropteridine diphosphokinase [Bacteroidota bacterium]